MIIMLLQLLRYISSELVIFFFTSSGSKSVLLHMKVVPSRVSTSVISKPFTASPALQYGPFDSYIPDYLRARRGPFTPGIVLKTDFFYLVK